MRSLVEVTEQLAAATALFHDAEIAESVARNNRCTALNDLNKIQSEFDDIVEAMKDKSPSGSDWKRDR